MAGSTEGGINARNTNYKRHGKDFYKRIGAIGGRKGRTGGFAAGEAGRARAARWGKIGGRTSKPGKAKSA